MAFQFDVEMYVSIRTSFNLRNKRDQERSRSIHWSYVLFQSPHFDTVDIKSRFENRKTTL